MPAAEIAVDPVGRIGIHILRERVLPADLPGQTQEKFYFLFQRLHGPAVQDPQLSDPFRISLLQLVARMGKGNGAEEHIGHTRRRPVGIMIINPVSAAAVLFLFRRIAADIAVVIICPYQSHVLRDFQTVVIQLQHLFIGNKGHHGITAQGLGEDAALIPDNGFQKLRFCLSFLFLRLSFQRLRLKAGIMDPPHPQRITNLKFPVLFHTFPPVFLQDFPVSSRDGIIINRILPAL